MTDYIDNIQGDYESLFEGTDNMDELQLNPLLEEALSENVFIEYLFYDAIADGDMEWAKTWAEVACEISGIDIEDLYTSTTADELENFNPAESNDLFNSGEAMEYWEFQGDTNRCAQYSQLFVIEEFYDVRIDPDEFCAFSEANGWFSEEGGTSIQDMNKMLDYFGIDNELSDGNTMDDLMDCLENGGRVIVAIDSGEYWCGEDMWEDYFDPYGADHAIEVIGYNPETNCVIVNDSGNHDGCGCEIPLETFADAWADSNNTMIECYPPQQAA